MGCVAKINRLAPQAGEQYAYDAAGNLTRDKDGDAFAYDGENRQTTYNGGASVNGGATYSYDGDGRRVKKVAGVVLTIFVYDVMGQLVAEYSSEAPTENGTQYLTADSLGTPRVITGADGLVKGRHDYLPFGEEIGADVGGRTGQGYSQVDGVRQGFTGYEKDGETGLNYAQARYHSPTLGRFTSVDPVALTVARLYDPQQINLYAYTRNNPLSFIDPTGEIIDFANKDARKRFEDYERFLQENRDKKGFAALIATVQRLKDSDVTYKIALGDSNTFSGGTEGELSSDGKIINVTIGNVGGPSGEKFSLNSRFAHELEHARQFDSGEFAYAFDGTTGAKLPGAVAGDISSEVKAWQAQLVASSPTDFQVMGGSRHAEFQFSVLSEFGGAKTNDERAGVLARISDTYKSSYERTTREGTYGRNFTLTGVPPGRLIRPSDRTFPRAGGGTVRLFGRTYQP